MSPRSARLLVAACALLPVALTAGTLLRAQEGPRPGPAPAGAPPADGEPARPLWEDPEGCAACHVEDGWEAIRAPEAGFDHAMTGFPLRFAHAEVACEGCHGRGLDALTQRCASCHHDPHGNQNGAQCQRCHDERAWRVPRNFAAHERTRFPLTGAHASIACEACHRPVRGEALAITPTECAVCHARALRRARPDHVSAGFLDCGQCHQTSSWRGARYQHRFFLLQGAHALLRCSECHPGSTFTGTPIDCFGCHFEDYARTTNPPHAQQGFPTSCPQCHTQDRFRPARSP